MGNSNNHQHQHTHEVKYKRPSVNPNIIHAFNKLSNGEEFIDYEKFEIIFGKRLARPLWNYIKDDQTGDHNNTMNLDQFVRHAQSLIGMSTDIYVKMLLPVDVLLSVCFESVNIEPTDADTDFCEALKADMISNGETLEAVVSWKNSVCPRLCQSIQDKVLDIFFHNHRQLNKVESTILLDTEMFILIQTLPTTVYFAKLADSEEENCINWRKLYSSDKDGISINRLQKNIFDYKGATVSIFKLTNDEVFVIGSDKEWRHSLKKFGGPASLLIQLRPHFKRFEVEAPAIYCNFKNRSGFFGINFGTFLAIDGTLQNVAEIEVWGCASAEILEEQQKLQLRQQQQVERNAKVPMPGAWENNPDKQILEMAGFQFSSESNDRPSDEI